MVMNESINKFKAATAILKVLKQLGCPASQVAEKLGTSTTTVCHWKGTKSSYGKAVAPPSDLQLCYLRRLLVDQVIDNLNAVSALLSGGYLGALSLLECLHILTSRIGNIQNLLVKRYESMGEYSVVVDLQRMQGALMDGKYGKGKNVDLHTLLDDIKKTLTPEDTCPECARWEMLTSWVNKLEGKSIGVNTIKSIIRDFSGKRN